MGFDNCIIESPDGEILSRCGKRKIEWYLSKNLANLVAENPLTIRLNFEPKGRDGANDPLIEEGKPNICVVCGTEHNLTKHHILPYSFAKYMDEKCKSNLIHDILLLCRTCHDDYEKKSLEKRKEIAKEFGISIYGISSEALKKVHKAASSANALLKYKNRIPLDRQQQLWENVKEFLGKGFVTQEDLECLKSYDISTRPDYINFCKYVAENLEDYSEFAKEWRSHFIETMSPQHLPETWKKHKISFV